ncbi:hypothetical protein [Streptomyces sp. NPDC088812]|uniref:hypothetical protein n=1 Tax=Streptomyces sp. NPDC088812 TaxID=3365905 RepID=UPI003827DC7E
MRSCYVFPSTVADPASPGLRALLFAAAAAGLDTVVTKSEAITVALADEARRFGLRLLASVACFRGPEGPRAVGDDGLGWQSMEWYTGVRPNDPVWNEQLVRSVARIAATTEADGLVLDFLRWPLHWELELRPGARPRSASYDARTLAQFTAHSGIRLHGDTGADAARRIARDHADAWTRYRTGTVTEVARQLRDAVREARPGLWLGAFLVPTDDDATRRRLVGQDAVALGELFDGLLPMTYHAIVHREPGWVGTVTRALPPTARAIPMVQTTADALSVIGDQADWGPQVSIDDFTEALRHALAAGDGRYCLFPAEGLTPAHFAAIRTTHGAAHAR